MKKRFYILLFCLLSVVVNAQEISNVTFQQVGKTIEVSYDLSGTKIGTIQLFYSTNDGKFYNGPLKAVSGAVGKNQNSGTAKKIIWDVLEEGIEITGNVKFKVKYKSGKYGSLTDTRDGKIYKTVKIGNQFWMAENLAYKPSWGGPYWIIGQVWDYGDKTKLAKYGYLYGWEIAKEVCPTGWHLPNDGEWTVLTEYLGGEEVAGIKLKSISGWKKLKNIENIVLDGNGTNESGFNALPGGSNWSVHYPSEGYIGKQGQWWSYERFKSRVLLFDLSINKTVFQNTDTFDTRGLSVRCIKD